MKEVIAAMAPPPAFGKYVYWASLYSICVCVLYLWGYWSTFDINILQYSDVSTILKLAAIPLLAGSVGLMTGSILGQVMFGSQPSEEEILATGNSRFGSWVHRHREFLSKSWVIFTVFFALLGPENKWEILPVLIALPVASVLNSRGFGAEVLPNPGVRRGIIFLLVLVVPFSYSIGLRAAQRIENGTVFSYVLSPINGLEVKSDAPLELRPRFIGQVTDLLFVYNPVDNSVSVIKFDEEKALTLKRFAKPSKSLSDLAREFWTSL